MPKNGAVVYGHEGVRHALRRRISQPGRVLNHKIPARDAHLTHEGGSKAVCKRALRHDAGEAGKDAHVHAAADSVNVLLMSSRRRQGRRSVNS